MWMRLAAYADVGYVRADQAFYRRHDNNMSRGLSDRLVHLRQRRAAYEAVLSAAATCCPMRPGSRRWCTASWPRRPCGSPPERMTGGRTDTVPVEELVAFAFDCWPDAASLGTYRSLQWRRRIGPTVMPYLQPFDLAAARRARR